MLDLTLLLKGDPKARNCKHSFLAKFYHMSEERRTGSQFFHGMFGDFLCMEVRGHNVGDASGLFLLTWLQTISPGMLEKLWMGPGLGTLTPSPCCWSWRKPLFTYNWCGDMHYVTIFRLVGTCGLKEDILRFW